MQFLFRSLPKPLSQSQNHHRTFIDSTFECVRDRGLDHAVEREKNLKPVINVKNLIKSEPSKSLPISTISQNKDFLKIPIRPIDFIRKYPSIFEEFLPGGIGIHPHVKLTQEVLNLDADEQLVYQSESYRQQVADRLLKLLMISRINKVPLKMLDSLKWDLGLPQDYVTSIVPEFPDYFRVVGNEDLGMGDLELVCWSNDLAVSVMERKAMNGKMDYAKGMAIPFPMQFSRGFEMDKKVKKWVDEWQKLPYISPYENAAHLPPKSDESDRWAVAVLHEVLHLLVGKKADRENVLFLGEYFGIRSWFKRALLHHPGIFYLSSKIGTYTVVLRETYKRGLLIENNPLMNIRNQYIHLMNTVKEGKAISVPNGSKQQQKATACESIGGEDVDNDDNSVEENEVESYESSDWDDDDEEEEEEEDEEEDERQTGAHKNVTIIRGRTTRKVNLDVKGPLRNFERERQFGKHNDKVPPTVSGRTEMHGRHNVHGKSRERSDSHNNVMTSRGRTIRKKNLDVTERLRNSERERPTGKHNDKVPPTGPERTEMHGRRHVHRKSQERFDSPKNVTTSRGRETRNKNLDATGPLRNSERERPIGKHHDKVQPIGSGRTEMHGRHNVHGKSQERSVSPKSRVRSLPDKRTSV